MIIDPSLLDYEVLKQFDLNLFHMSCSLCTLPSKFVYVNVDKKSVIPYGFGGPYCGNCALIDDFDYIKYSDLTTNEFADYFRSLLVIDQ
jgi:hypothetical protein